MLGLFLDKRSSLENFRFFSEALEIVEDDVDVDEVGVDGPLVKLAFWLLEILEVEDSSMALWRGVTVHLLLSGLLSSLMADDGLERTWLVTIQPPLVDPVELSLWTEGLWWSTSVTCQFFLVAWTGEEQVGGDDDFSFNFLTVRALGTNWGLVEDNDDDDEFCWTCFLATVGSDEASS